MNRYNLPLRTWALREVRVIQPADCALAGVASGVGSRLFKRATSRFLSPEMPPNPVSGSISDSAANVWYGSSVRDSHWAPALEDAASLCTNWRMRR